MVVKVVRNVSWKSGQWQGAVAKRGDSLLAVHRIIGDFNKV